MKKLFLIILLFPLLILGQSGVQNYVKSTTMQDSTASGMPPIIQVSYFDGFARPKQQITHNQSGTGTDIVIHMTYDKFGRQLKQYLPIVGGQNLEYHAIDSTAVMQYYANPTAASIASTSVPYSEKQYEASPLNRVLKQASPGTPWAMGSGHEVRFDYQTNNQSEDQVYILRVATTPASGIEAFEPNLIQEASFYPTGTLYKSITKNENWSTNQAFPKLNTTEEYKNKEEQVILKRSYDLVENNEKAHDTYYVYDDFGNLTYIIPPLASACACSISSVLDDLCYQYKYDYRNRIVEKKLPGKQWQFIVYNNQDKPVATGPTLNPWGDNSWGWTITKYDVFGRIVYTGWKADTVSSESRKSMQQSIGALWYESATATNTIDDVEVSYTNSTNPTDFKLLKVNYYDSYGHSFASATIPDMVEGTHVTTKLKGLSTGNWERVLTTSSETLANVTHLFYDYKGRIVRNDVRNYLGGYTVTDNKLNFSGKVLQCNVAHKRNLNDNAYEIKTKDFFTYSDQGRLLTHIQQINELPKQLLAKNEYDELGQLKSKQMGGTDVTNCIGLQKVDYRYNCRGWLKNINDVDELQEVDDNTVFPVDLFAFQINYDDPESNANNQVNGLFNGNISETSWRSSADNVKRKYGYQYDSLNRLHKAIYQKPESNVPVTDMYNEEMDYDLNGNIQWLKRNGDLDDPYATFAIEIDNLTYAYDAQKKNQLARVTDASIHPKGFKDDPVSIQNATSNMNLDGSQVASSSQNENPPLDYAYDENGNMLTDANKGITSIHYNYLNLPVTINFDSSNKIEYVYDAAGQKVQKKVTNGTVETITDYLNGFQYTNTALSFFPHAEGYVNVTECESCQEKNKNLFDYVFNYTDQLGNVRLSWALDKTPNVLKIVEENNYYPFGLKHTHYNVDHKHFEMLIRNEGEQQSAMMPLTRMAQVIGGNSNLQVDNKYRFQGQERQEDLGLNWDSFKYRNYDYTIGRFMNIDPLTEKYNTWSPYAFSGNRVVDSRELEGLEPQTIHFTKVDAAKNFGDYYNGASILEKREYGSSIYSQTTTFNTPLGSIPLTTYSYNEASPGRETTTLINDKIPSGATLVGDIHSHGASTANDENVYDDNDFSYTDIIAALNLADTIPGYTSYITTPDGSLIELDVENPGEIIRSTEMPSDPNDPGRLNSIDPKSKIEEERERIKNDLNKALQNIKPIN